MMSSENDHSIEPLLEFLYHSRGFDFSGYKRPSLTRRINRRMQMMRVDNYDDYIDYLEVHPGEFTLLFNTILINVTAFFRDSEAWWYLRDQVIPQLVEKKRPDDPIRVWSAGTASGEEAFSMAMIMSEILGVEAFKRRVKIYGTDLDEEALTKARQAQYTKTELEGVPEPYIEKYFEPAGSNYVFDKDLRRCVIFGRNDLLQDAPISRVDILTCRNTLMYFNTEKQTNALARFHFGLADGGVLFLGRAEMLLSDSELFNPLHLKYRIFKKLPNNRLRDRLHLLTQPVNMDNGYDPIGNDVLWNITVERAPNPIIVLDAKTNLRLVNERARTIFGISMRDIGRKFSELEFSYRLLDLRTAIKRVVQDLSPIVLDDIEGYEIGGSKHYMQVFLQPLIENDLVTGISISFYDTTAQKMLQMDLIQAKQELETTLEELQSTNEELETTNEELQSTIEELETTNEEFQSTNEELETMNEELQSGNEELEAMNEELQTRTEELNETNAFLSSIISSVPGSIVVLDPELRILIWSERSEDLWGLWSNEVRGRNFLTLDCGLPVEELRRPILDCLSDSTKRTEVILDARTRLGREIKCKVVCNPLFDQDRSSRGVILVMSQMEEK